MSTEAKTVLGKQLRALRAKIVASEIPLLDWNDLDIAMSEAVAEAVKAERERNAVVFTRYVAACNDAWGPGASNPPRSSEYLAEILAVTPDVSPPAEPMTIEEAIEKLVSTYPNNLVWKSEIKTDLRIIAKAQAKEDAATCLAQQQAERGSLHDGACRDCHDAILKTVGPE